MNKEEFSKVLDLEGYSYEIEGDKIIVTHRGYVWLDALTSLPPGVKFENKGYVSLYALKSLPHGVVFRNEWSVRLDALIGGWFFEWKGNIEGIKKEKLLNLMIKRGMFI